MPRFYRGDTDDRYILEEEGDVTEINFVIKGEWGIGFSTHTVVENENYRPPEIKEEVETPLDMKKAGHYLA